MAEIDLLFVYGTLRSSTGDGMHPLLGMAVFVGEAWWCGRLYLVDSYPGAVPDETCSSRVAGELYRLSHTSQALAALDAYEECGPPYGADAEYVRTVTRVTLSDGTELDAWIYLYNRPVGGLTLIDSGDFCNHRQGA
ncbi:MAG TPA: gamma-glutamylcyclotransferase family protein [Geobacteraceae bacterium]|nr:gamma-glutamylcyclotransferase family protein [Geobacteraceae bacterium]